MPYNKEHLPRPKKELPLEELGELYARPGGGHYHMSRSCRMLQGGQFGEYGYVVVSPDQVRQRGLQPCPCARTRKVESDHDNTQGV